MCNDALRDSESNREPLVSVLVPSYSHERYIVECLESIKNLNYRRLELIVSDDCSQDDTYALAEEWAQRNAERFEHTSIGRQAKNIGLVRNLQSLLNSARGDYLAYIASDDLFLESAFLNRVRLLQTYRYIDAVFGNAQLISSSGAVLKDQFIPKRIGWELSSSKLLVSSLLINWCVPGPVMMIRRDAVLENGSLGLLPEDLTGEDRYIYVRLASRCKLLYVDDIVAKCRFVPGSLSRPTSASSTDNDYCAQSDVKNRHLLSGFNRFVIENQIATASLRVKRDNIAFYGPKKLLVRCITKLLRTSLRICAILFKTISVAGYSVEIPKPRNRIT